jgi:hypothetical protein
VTSDESAYACASGCTSRGRHLVECEHREDGECTGCLPRLATSGCVCSGCTGRYVRSVSEAPDLIAHLRSQLGPAAAAQEDGKSKPKGKGQGKHTPAPMSIDVVDIADRLYAELVGWVRLTCDDLGLTMPTIHGWRPEGADGQIAGLKPAAPDDSPTMATVLLRHADRVYEQPWVTVLIAELGTLVHRADRTWPRVERPVYLPTPCPACDMLSLVRYAPSWAGAPITVRCNRDECGEIIPEDMYAWQARRVLAERQEAERAKGAA